MGKILGIDLGTSNSCMAVMEGGEAKVIPNAEGHRTTPSVVAFTKSGDRLVGAAAKRQSVTNPTNTLFSIKRFMGRKYDEVKHEIELVPYKVVKATNGDAHVQVGDKTYSPPEISSMILAKLKADAEAYLGETITEAVITVPAYFNDSQRQATKDAGKIAGLDVRRIINEPTAASLAYGLEKGQEHKIAVYDFGGGTFDVSILELGEGVFEVKATNGDTHLGGDDVDEAIITWLADIFKSENGIDPRKDPMALQRLKDAAEKAKCELSSSQSSEIALPYITAVNGEARHLTQTLTRAKLEQLADSLVDRTRKPCLDCLKDSGCTTGDIDEVVLVGGQTRMPMIIEIAKKVFGRDPHRGVNPDEVVAVGAAIQGGVLSGDVNDVLLLDVTPLSLGIKTQGGIFTKMIERNTTIPTKKSETFSTAADSQPSVDIEVYQGEREMADHNKKVGNFRLDGIAPAPRGVPQIEVSFDIDVNGILHVTAKDKGTGKENKITITASSGLSDADIEKMVEDAKAHAEEDKLERERVETKNHAESLVFNTEKQLKELGEQMPAEIKDPIQADLDALKSAIAANDTDKMKSLMEQLRENMQKIGEELYGKMGAQGAPGAEGAPGAGPGAGAAGAASGMPDMDDVIDADFEEVEDDKKG